MKEFLKSFFSFGLATTIEKIIAFILVPIYTHFFNQAEFGVIDLIQVVLGVASIFAVLQLETALQRYYYDYQGEKKKAYLSTIFITVFFLSWTVVAILFFAASNLSWLLFQTDSYAHLIRLAAFQLPFINCSMLGFVLLRFEKMNKQFVLLILVKVLLSLSFILLLVVWLERGIYGIFIAQLVGLITSFTLLLYSIRHLIGFQLVLPYLVRSTRYALPQFPARIGSILLSYGNRFFMVGYLTLTSIGIYSLSLKFASIIQLVYAAFIMAWAPFMFEYLKKPEHKLIFPKVLRLAACVVFFMVSFISIFSYEIVSLIATEGFREAHLYLGGLSLYFSMLIFKEIVDIGPKIIEKTKYLTYTFLLSVVVNLISLFFFIRAFGITGVVFSMILSNTFLLAVSWTVSNRLHFIPFSFVGFVVAAFPAYILAIGSMYITPNLVVRVFAALAIILLYAVLFKRSYSSFKLITKKL